MRKDIEYAKYTIYKICGMTLFLELSILTLAFFPSPNPNSSNDDNLMEVEFGYAIIVVMISIALAALLNSITLSFHTRKLQSEIIKIRNGVVAISNQQGNGEQNNNANNDESDTSNVDHNHNINNNQNHGPKRHRNNSKDSVVSDNAGNNDPLANHLSRLRSLTFGIYIFAFSSIGIIFIIIVLFLALGSIPYSWILWYFGFNILHFNVAITPLIYARKYHTNRDKNDAERNSNVRMIYQLCSVCSSNSSSNNNSTKHQEKHDTTQPTSKGNKNTQVSNIAQD